MRFELEEATFAPFRNSENFPRERNWA